MRKTLFFLVIAIAAGAAQAQIKCWNDAQGKRVCGDTPPPGAKVSTVRGTVTPSGPAPAPSGAAQKGAKKSGPLTPAEQEQEYRKRQAESQKAAAKADQEEKEKSLKNQNCEQAKDSLRMLESGVRITRTNPSGERYYLNETQIEQEIAKGRAAVQRSCN